MFEDIKKACRDQVYLIEGAFQLMKGEVRVLPDGKMHPMEGKDFVPHTTKTESHTTRGGKSSKDRYDIHFGGRGSEHKKVGEVHRNKTWMQEGGGGKNDRYHAIVNGDKISGHRTKSGAERAVVSHHTKEKRLVRGMESYLEEIGADRVAKSYVGFKNLVAQGKSPDLAAWIGRKKYGKEGMAQMSDGKRTAPEQAAHIEKTEGKEAADSFRRKMSGKKKGKKETTNKSLHGRIDDLLKPFQGTPFYAQAMEIVADHRQCQVDLNKIDNGDAGLKVSSGWNSLGLNFGDRDKASKNKDKRDKLYEKMSGLEADYSDLEAKLLRWGAKNIQKEDKVKKSIREELNVQDGLLMAVEIVHPF